MTLGLLAGVACAFASLVELVTGLKGRSKRPIHLFGEAWGRGFRFIAARVLLDAIIGFLAFTVMKALRPSLIQGFSAVPRPVTAVLYGLLGPVVLRTHVLPSGTNARAVNLLWPLLKWRSYLDDNIANISALVTTSWKDNEAIPLIKQLEPNTIKRKVDDWFSYNDDGGLVASKRKFIDNVLKNSTPATLDDQIDAVVGALLDLPHGRRFICLLMAEATTVVDASILTTRSE